jgi:TusA-related sulfurtransferase
MAETVKIVDARGSFCPGPLMELIKGIRQEPVGTILEIWSSDQGSAKDIPEWVQRAKHELVKNFEEDGVYKIQVKKLR